MPSRRDLTSVNPLQTRGQARRNSAGEERTPKRRRELGSQPQVLNPVTAR